MKRFMMIFGVSLVAAGLMVSGCKDPAKNKPKAKTGDPKPEPKPQTGAETLAVSNANSTISFVGSKVTGKHDGGFKKWSGTVSAKGGDPLTAQIRVTIDMGSIFADNAKLTGHLKSPDFFDVKKFPTATFVSTGIKKGGAKGASHTVTGNLTMKGIKKSVEFPATIKVTDTEITAKAEFAINRFDWKVEYKGMANDLIRKLVVIKLDIKAPRKKG